MFAGICLYQAITLYIESFEKVYPYVEGKVENRYALLMNERGFIEKGNINIITKNGEQKYEFIWDRIAPENRIGLKKQLNSIRKSLVTKYDAKEMPELIESIANDKTITHHDTLWVTD